MEKKVEVLKKSCDWCGNESYEKCLGCGKDVCWECQKTKGIKYQHAVHFSGSGDGFFCQSCLDNPPEKILPKLKAYQKIRALRNESKGFYEDWEKRSKEAEKELKEL